MASAMLANTDAEGRNREQAESRPLQRCAERAGVYRHRTIPRLERSQETAEWARARPTASGAMAPLLEERHAGRGVAAHALLVDLDADAGLLRHGDEPLLDLRPVVGHHLLVHGVGVEVRLPLQDHEVGDR